MPNLVLLAGIPGSGKSTWARTFMDLKYTVANPDAIRIREFGSLEAAWHGDTKANNKRVFAIYHDRIKDALVHGIDVIADATHLTSRSRADIRRLTYGIEGVRTHLVLFKNIQSAIGRNAERVGAAAVPDTVQSAMVNNYFGTLSDLADGEAALYDTVTHISTFS